jgi:hypothetical protein
MKKQRQFIFMRKRKHKRFSHIAQPTYKEIQVWRNICLQKYFIFFDKRRQIKNYLFLKSIKVLKIRACQLENVSIEWGLGASAAAGKPNPNGGG